MKGRYRIKKIEQCVRTCLSLLPFSCLFTVRLDFLPADLPLFGLDFLPLDFPLFGLDFVDFPLLGRDFANVFFWMEFDSTHWEGRITERHTVEER